MYFSSCPQSSLYLTLDFPEPLFLYLPSLQRSGLENKRSLVQSQDQPIFSPRTDDNHSHRIHSFLTAAHPFNAGYVGK